MELDLVEITTLATGEKRYFAVNDRHYDAMLACGGSDLDLVYSWRRLGTVVIEEEILHEEGWQWRETG